MLATGKSVAAPSISCKGLKSDCDGRCSAHVQSWCDVACWGIGNQAFTSRQIPQNKQNWEQSACLLRTRARDWRLACTTKRKPQFFLENRRRECVWLFFLFVSGCNHVPPFNHVEMPALSLNEQSNAEASWFVHQLHHLWHPALFPCKPCHHCKVSTCI